MTLMRPALALTVLVACAAPAAAQRYTAKQEGDLIELADATSRMNVSVVWNMCNAWRIQVKGKDLVRTSATLADFQARPGFNGMPILAPFANRLDETAFYANGKKYNFNLELGNVRGPIPSTGYVNGSKAWQLVEAKADERSAWVSCRLDFYEHPLFMAQFPFAHSITLTYRVSDGALEVHTRLDNLSAEPMPVAIGFHPFFQLTDSPRDEWVLSIGARTHWLLADTKMPTGQTQPIATFLANPAAIELAPLDLDDVFSDLVRDARGRATMSLRGKTQRLEVVLGANYRAVVIYAPK